MRGKAANEPGLVCPETSELSPLALVWATVCDTVEICRNPDLSYLKVSRSSGFDMVLNNACHLHSLRATAITWLKILG
jgi:hypothetical protein